MFTEKNDLEKMFHVCVCVCVCVSLDWCFFLKLAKGTQGKTVDIPPSLANESVTI